MGHHLSACSLRCAASARCERHALTTQLYTMLSYLCCLTRMKWHRHTMAPFCKHMSHTHALLTVHMACTSPHLDLVSMMVSRVA